jgi:hypothetical protein
MSEPTLALHTWKWTAADRHRFGIGDRQSVSGDAILPNMARSTRSIRVVGGVIAVVSFAVSIVLYLFVAGDPVAGSANNNPTWMTDLGAVMALGTAVGLSLLVLPTVVDIWRDPQNWLRWRLRLYTRDQFPQWPDRA